MGMELSCFEVRNLHESHLLLPDCAGWFLILKELFAGGGGCNLIKDIFMDLVHGTSP
jgi:hypothetical protein